MLNFKRVPFWENRKRVSYLTEFRIQCVAYFKNAVIDDSGELYQDNTAIDIRRRLNNKLILARDYIISAGINPSYNVLPAPGVLVGGGYDLIHHLFELRTIGTETFLLDIIDRAIGVYKENYLYSIVRTFNPLHWVVEFFIWIMNLPIKIIRIAGFRIQEESFLAAIIRIVTLLGSIATTISKLIDLAKKLNITLK